MFGDPFPKCSTIFPPLFLFVTLLLFPSREQKDEEEKWRLVGKSESHNNLLPEATCSVGLKYGPALVKLKNFPPKDKSDFGWLVLYENPSLCLFTVGEAARRGVQLLCEYVTGPHFQDITWIDSLRMGGKVLAPVKPVKQKAPPLPGELRSTGLAPQGY